MRNPLALLIELAAPQHGLFTTAQATGAGINAVRLHHLASGSVIEPRSHGVYRITTYPFTEHSELMEAVLWANGRGIIVGESALALWDLADVNPSKIHLGIPPGYRPRKRGGEQYALHAVRLEPHDLDHADGIPVATPSTAIRQAIKWGTPGDMIEQAVRRGQAHEHFGTPTASRLLVALYDRQEGSP